MRILQGSLALLLCATALCFSVGQGFDCHVYMQGNDSHTLGTSMTCGAGHDKYCIRYARLNASVITYTRGCSSMPSCSCLAWTGLADCHVCSTSRCNGGNFSNISSDSFTPTTGSISCYVYSGSDLQATGTKHTCGPDYHCISYALESSTGTTYRRGCSSVTSCSCLDWTGLAKCKVCSTDYCNSASIISSGAGKVFGPDSRVLMTLAIATALLVIGQ